MGFSLGNAAGAIATGGLSLLGRAVPGRPDAPNLPPAPTLQAPQLPNYPGMSPQTQALLQQFQQYLSQSQNAVQNYGNSPYMQQSGQADQQALTNYQNALQGKIAPNQMIEQQKQEAWNQMKQNAAQQGIRIAGDTPQSAVSQSTAGNQQIADFNKSWAAQEQNYNLGQQSLGMQAQGQALGQQNQQFQNTLGGYNTLAGMNTTLQNPYQQQTLGQFGVQTNQALQNANVSNQNLLNTYQQQTGQTLANYNNSLAGYNTNMGLLQSGLGLAGNLVGAGFAGGGGSAGAGNAGMAGGSMGFSGVPQASNRTNLYNPGGSYIS